MADVIADAAAVYWEDRQAHTIQRAMMDGSGTKTVMSNVEIEGDVVVPGPPDAARSGAGITADDGFVHWLGGLVCTGIYRVQNDGTGAKASAR